MPLVCGSRWICTDIHAFGARGELPEYIPANYACIAMTGNWAADWRYASARAGAYFSAAAEMSIYSVRREKEVYYKPISGGEKITGRLPN